MVSSGDVVAVPAVPADPGDPAVPAGVPGRVVSLCAQPERERHNPAVSKNTRFIHFSFYVNLIDCKLKGPDQYLLLPVLVAVCRLPERAGHFPEDPA